MAETTWDRKAASETAQGLYLADRVVDQHEALFTEILGWHPVTAT
jgi:hypothetical protein